MFKTVKRIIDWCGEFKGKLYLGFVMTFSPISSRRCRWRSRPTPWDF